MIESIEGFDGTSETVLESLVAFVERVAFDRRNFFDELNPHDGRMTRAQWTRLGASGFMLQSALTSRASPSLTWVALAERLQVAMRAISG